MVGLTVPDRAVTIAVTAHIGVATVSSVTTTYLDGSLSSGFFWHHSNSDDQHQSSQGSINHGKSGVFYKRNTTNETNTTSKVTQIYLRQLISRILKLLNH